MLRVKIEGGDVNTIYEKLNNLGGADVVDIADADSNRFTIDCKPDQDVATQVFNMCVSNSLVITELIPVETKLEDIFKEFTTD